MELDFCHIFHFSKTTPFYVHKLHRGNLIQASHRSYGPDENHPTVHPYIHDASLGSSR